jgi:hypothetical protein
MDRSSAAIMLEISLFFIAQKTICDCVCVQVMLAVARGHFLTATNDDDDGKHLCIRCLWLRFETIFVLDYRL